MKNDPIEITPHTEEGRHTDIAATALYNTTVSIVNSERTVVWQRYQALLLANSIVFGFMGRSDLSGSYIIITGVLGLALCYCWWKLTWDGWRFFELYSQMARRFRWPAVDDAVNANEEMFKEFQIFKESKGKSFLFGTFCEGDAIKTAALGVIILFACAYMMLMILRLTMA